VNTVALARAHAATNRTYGAREQRRTLKFKCLTPFAGVKSILSPSSFHIVSSGGGSDASHRPKLSARTR